MTTTIYGSNVHDTILSTACQMAPNSGGTETSVTTTIPSTSQPYAEFRSQGGSSTAVASLPSPTGNGWVWWCGAGSIAAGNWSAIATNSSVSKGVSTTIRFYKISSSFTYTAIGTITVTQTATGKTTYTYSSTAMSSVTTSSGDGIYIDRWWFNNNANAGSDNPVNYVSNSATAGVVNDMQVSFPTFVPASTPVSKDTAFRGNIAKLINKDSVYRGLISTIGRKDTKWRGNIGHTSLKDTKWRAVLALTSAKNTAFRGKVSNTTKKDTKWRGNIGHSVFKDTKFRGVLANTTVKNTAYRGNVGHTGAHDTTWRAHIASISLFYVSNIAQTLGGLVLSDQMSMQAGGTETSFTVTMPASGTNSYVELLAQGGSSSSTPVLPAPTGKGWSINLAGNTILAGSWSSIFTLAKSGTIKTGASLIVRYYRRTMDGVYNPIGVSTLTGQSFSTVKTVYTTPSVLQSWPFQFIQGDTLYMDAFVLNGASAWASDVFTVYVSNSATMGVYGDGTIIAPEMISTPDGLTCLIGATNFQTGDALSIRDQSITIADAVDQRSIATLVGEDIDGTLSYQRAMPVQLSDSEQGVLYTGAVNSDKVSKPAAGNSNAQLEHALTFMDNHYLVDKRKNKTNYLNWSSGDMMCDFIQQTLSQEGITGQFALESDYTPTTFGQGTLSGTVATTTTSPFVYAPNTATPPVTSNTGDLELTRAGTKFTLTEETTADFATGTLTNMTASGNSLQPTTVSALKFTADLPLAGSGNSVGVPAFSGPSGGTIEQVSCSVYAKIWSGSQSIGANDTFNYDIFIDSTSPASMAGVDLLFSDGTKLSSYNGSYLANAAVWDQNGLSPDVLTDLSDYAQNNWYTRNISLNTLLSGSVGANLNGKTVTAAYLFIAGGAAGQYTVYVKNCYIGSHSGSPIFSTSATVPQVNPPVVTTDGGGYVLTTGIVSVVNAWIATASSRVSPAHSISSVGLVQNSNIQWTASLPTTGTAPTPYPPGFTSSSSSSGETAPAALISVSYDGTTWLTCTNNAPLPGLPAGANVSGLSLYLQEQFQAGNDPTALPSLLQVTITINSAAAQTTSDVIAAYGTTATWNTGTAFGVAPNAQGDLALLTSALSWNTSTGVTTFTDHATATVGTGTVTINTTATFGAGSARLDFAGFAQNFTANFTMKLSSASINNPECFFFYRASDVSVAAHSGIALLPNGYALRMFINGSGSNNAIIEVLANGTSLTSSTRTMSLGTTYSFKVVVAGNVHAIYLSGSLLFAFYDTAVTQAGSFGFALQGSGTTNDTAVLGSVSITAPLLKGTWTSPAIPLNSLGTCGYTQIAWTEQNTAGATQSQAIVLATLDGGSTWQPCANGAEVPGLTPGTSVSGVSLQIQMVLFATSIITSPIVTGLYARVCGTYGTVTGTRISPALSLTPVGYVAASNCMYNANIPTGTSLTVQTTQDLSTFHTVGNNGAGEALPYWTNQPDATQDLFGSNTSANYTSTSKSGGSTASVTYETALSRITLAGGSSALYVNLAINTADVDMLVDMDRSESGGMVFRFVDTSNFYEVAVYDASSSSGFANQLRLYKVASGTRTLLGSASATFTRNTFHRPRVSMQGGLINVYWDGTCLLSYLDTSPLSSGACGLRNDGGTSRYYQLWVQPLGTNLSGQVLYTKVTMTTSDPAMMPQLFTLVCCVRGPNIATGATISQLHPITKPVATYYHQEMDTLTQASGDFFWMVDKWREMHFGERLARPGAFPIQSITDQDTANPINVKSGYLLYRPQVTVLTSADLFRNRETITNVSGLVTPPPEIKVCDGSVTSWQMGYPLYSAPIILINGQPATIGLQGTDNNRQFYWQPGSASISYDSSLPKLPAGTVLSFTYVGESPVDVELNNTASQIAQAALELNSGIVDEITSALNNTAAGMNTDQATVFGQGLLDRYGKNDPIALSGTTRYIGLAPGTTIALFAPEMLSVWNAQLPITKLTTMVQKGVGGLIWTYAVDATNGPSISNWTRMWRPK